MEQPIFAFNVVSKITIVEDCWDSAEEHYYKPIDERKRQLHAGEVYDVNYVFRNFFGRFANITAHGYEYDVNLHHCKIEIAIKRFYGECPNGKNWEEFDPRCNGYAEVKDDKPAPERLFNYALLPDFQLTKRDYILPNAGRLHEVMDLLDFDVKLDMQVSLNTVNMQETYGIAETTKLITDILCRNAVLTSYWYVDISNPDDKHFYCLYGGPQIKLLSEFIHGDSSIALMNDKGEYDLWLFNDLPEQWQNQLSSYCIQCFAYTAKTYEERLSNAKIAKLWMHLNISKFSNVTRERMNIIKYIAFSE
jgi:hypothetical protein